MAPSLRHLVIAIATALAGCGAHDGGNVPMAGPRSPLFDSTAYVQVSARLRDAFVFSDTVYCDSVLPLFDDTALARSYPERVVDGFVSNLIGHDAPQPATMKRFGELAEYADAPVLRNWHAYVEARAIQNAGAPRLAIAELEPLLALFQQDHDTVGMASVRKRIGTLYLDLGEPSLAAFHLAQARAMEPRVDLRSTITATLGRCYAAAGNADSVLWCAQQLVAEANDPLTRLRGDGRAAINAQWLRHLAALASPVGDTVRRALERSAQVDAAIQSRDKDHGYLVAADPAARVETMVLRARAYLLLSRAQEARTVLGPVERELALCPACLPQRSSYLSALADAWKALGDLRSALRYQQERADVLAMNTTGRERIAVEQARSKAQRELQETDNRQALETERIVGMANDKEQRMQRAYLSMMVAFVALFGALLFVRARLHRRIQLEQVRTRLSRDLHDDIGATLSSINILSTVAQRKAEAGDEAGAAASLTGISERTQRLMRSMSDIVWSVDPDRDSMEELLVRMREFGAAVLEPKDINYRVECRGELQTTLPPAVRSNLYLLFKEAVNNAAKHAEASEVTVCLEHEPSRLRLTIRDNGKGMDLHAQGNGKSTGNGQRNMRARAAEMKAELHVDSAPGQGTTVRLVVPL